MANIVKTSLIFLIALAYLAAAIDCPPLGTLDGLDLEPGHCVASYICVGEDGTMVVYNFEEETALSCQSTVISLRCAGDHDTVTFAEPWAKCDYAIIEFEPDGIIKQTCCHDQNGAKDDDKQKPLGGDDDDKKGEGEKKGKRRCDVDPDLPCPEDEDGKKDEKKGDKDDKPGEKGKGDEYGKKKGTRRCDIDPDLPCEDEKDQPCVAQKDTTKPPRLDEEDPTYVWACYCNQGEEPQRMPLVGIRPASNDANGCPIIDLAIQKINGTDFTIFCDKLLSSSSYQNATTPAARDCAGLCAADANCWGCAWSNSTCRLHAESSGTKVVVGNSTIGWVALIKNNATATPTTSDQAEGADQVVLSSPTSIVGDLSGAPENIDDEFYALQVPFPITVYDHSSDSVYVSSNGLLTLDSGSRIFENTALPATNLPPYAVMGLWGDLYIYKDTAQGIYYQVDGDNGSRTVTFEFYVSRYRQQNQYYHFTMAFYEGKPGVITLRYYDVSDKGAQSTVGAQGGQANKQFSFNSPVINNGLELTIDTTGNSVVESTFQT